MRVCACVLQLANTPRPRDTRPRSRAKGASHSSADELFFCARGFNASPFLLVAVQQPTAGDAVYIEALSPSPICSVSRRMCRRQSVEHVAERKPSGGQAGLSLGVPGSLPILEARDGARLAPPNGSDPGGARAGSQAGHLAWSRRQLLGTEGGRGGKWSGTRRLCTGWQDP